MNRPKAKKPIAPCDDEIIMASGLAVVECSWARLDEVPFNRIKSPNERLCKPLHSCSCRRVPAPLTRSPNYPLSQCPSVAQLTSSALPHSHQPGQLRPPLAPQLRRGPRRRVLYHRPPGLGRGPLVQVFMGPCVLQDECAPDCAVPDVQDERGRGGDAGADTGRAGRGRSAAAG